MRGELKRALLHLRMSLEENYEFGYEIRLTVKDAEAMLRGYNVKFRSKDSIKELRYNANLDTPELRHHAIEARKALHDAAIRPLEFKRTKKPNSTKD